MYKEVILEQEWIQLRQCLGLSRLQTDIVRRLLCGKLRHEIARELGVSCRAVRTQTDHLYRDFGVSTRVELVVHVLTVLRELWKQEEESRYV